MSDVEFKEIIIRLLTGLEKRIQDIRDILTTEMDELKKNQSKMNSPTNEIRCTIDAMNSMLEEPEGRITGLEGKAREGNEVKQNREKIL